jgi:hypothetical protein
MMEIGYLREIADLKNQTAEVGRREIEILLKQISSQHQHRNDRDFLEESEAIQRGEIQRAIPTFYDKL